MPQCQGAMITHYGCFEDVSAVIDMCPPCGVSHAACLSFEVDHLFSGQSVLLDSKGLCLLIVSQSIVFSLRK